MYKSCQSQDTVESRRLLACFNAIVVGNLFLYYNIYLKRYYAYCLSNGNLKNYIRRFIVIGVTPAASIAYSSVKIFFFF